VCLESLLFLGSVPRKHGRGYYSLALSYDHRLINGQDAVQFLVQAKKVERPERMLLDV
jgi:pyruvate/2-oxoglutarate dehydrogenase complex dihydrolipoamide acyltransferase (E2) component